MVRVGQQHGNNLHQDPNQQASAHPMRRTPEAAQPPCRPPGTPAEQGHRQGRSPTGGTGSSAKAPPAKAQEQKP